MFSELEKKLLQHINDAAYRPVKPKVLARQLALPPEQGPELRRAIKQLNKQLQLKYGANHLVYPHSEDVRSDEVIGRFSRAAAGYGFVRPSGTHHGAGKARDIYIPESKTRDASTGDTVLVKVGKSQARHDDRARGEILRIVERRTHQFVGTYFEQRGRAYVTIDGKGFEQPVFVGDPGAKNAHANDKVVVEMVRFPDKRNAGEAVITEVLGDYRKSGVDTLTIIREFSLPEQFSEAAVQESREQAERFDETIDESRDDLTQQTIITIDPIDARDFDDAISLEKLDNGHWRLGVHIADVSHFVGPGTALDEEARDRATSVYLPDRVIPMLPEIISNNLASLQPDKVRYTKSALIEFSDEGVPIHTELCRSAIRSKRRFAYEEIDDFLGNREAWRNKLDADVFRLLGEMHTLAMILRQRRMARGALDITMPEIKLHLDRKGKVTGAYTEKNTESHQIIEEFMLAANIAVAEKLRDADFVFLRRVHASPSRRKIQTLTQFVKLLGLDVAGLENRFELKRLLELVRNTPLEPTVNLAVLQSMQKAVYSPEAEGHYALSAKCYCHFTSPIRRYPDLTVHRLVDLSLRHKHSAGHRTNLVTLGEHCSEREQRAEQAERELTKLKLLSYYATRLGEQLDAVVTGIESFGVFVQGVELPVEGLIHVELLTNDYYEFDADTFSLVGKRTSHQFQLGDVVRVQVANVDLARRELDFRYVEHVSSTLAQLRKKHKPRKTKGKDGGPQQGRRGSRREFEGGKRHQPETKTSSRAGKHGDPETGAGKNKKRTKVKRRRK